VIALGAFSVLLVSVALDADSLWRKVGILTIAAFILWFGWRHVTVELPISGQEREAFCFPNTVAVTWQPSLLDTSVRVEDPVKLATLLGGSKLYGNDLLVPLRELILNSADAIRARRVLDTDYKVTEENRYPGRIDITLESIPGSDDHYVFVDDDGIGMSESVMTGPLITFGKSFWTDPTASVLFPGLPSDPRFHPSGRFGIGFFSVFMISNEVAVTSRPADLGGRGEYKRKVLSFRAGSASRAELRDYDRSLGDSVPGWVSTRVKLRVSPAVFQSVHHHGSGISDTRKAFASYLTRLVLPLDVHVNVRTPEGLQTHKPHYSEWNADKLGEQLLTGEWSLDSIPTSTYASQLSLLTPIEAGGRLLGRIALSIHTGERCLVLKSVGGVLSKAPEDLDLFGVIEVSPDTAARAAGGLIADEFQMSLWARDQLGRIAELRLEPEEIANAVVAASRFNVDITNYAVVPSRAGNLSISSIVEAIAKSQIIAIPYTGGPPNQQRTLVYEVWSEHAKVSPKERVPSGMRLEFGGGISGNMRLSFQAARSIG
jgi:hypothetical protein